MSTATRSTKEAMGRHAGSTHRHDSSRLFTAPSRAFGFGVQVALARGALVGLWVFGGVDEMHANIKTSLLRLLSSVFLLTSLGEVFAENLAPAPYLDWGRELFRSYCASCHGIDGTGNGPAAGSLKAAPADLTRISKEGKFPRKKVIAYIDGETSVPAHGSREMPVWGRVLQEQRGGPFASAAARAEIYALTDYLESIQEKTAQELGTGRHL